MTINGELSAITTVLTSLSGRLWKARHPTWQGFHHVGVSEVEVAIEREGATDAAASSIRATKKESSSELKARRLGAALPMHVRLRYQVLRAQCWLQQL